MAVSTVRELIEELDNYGGHVKVKIRLDYGDPDKEQELSLAVEDGTDDEGDTCVFIEPE